MKKHYPVIRVSLLWIPYLLLFYFFGTLRIVFLTFMMIFIHECGHLLAAMWLQLSVTKIWIYPFGIFAEFKDIDFIVSKKELLLAIAGPCFQIMNFVVLNLLFQYDLLSYNQVNYYQMLNFQLAVFNLLPIYPLDGGRILRCMCHQFLPFVNASKCTLLLSFIVLMIAFLFFFHQIWIYIFILIYLFYGYKEWKQLIDKQLQFYFHRFTRDLILPLRIHKHHDLYRDYQNIIIDGRNRYSQKEWLNRIFACKDK